MASSGVTLIKRLPRPQIIFADIQREIGKQLQAVGRQHVNERKKVVSNFETDIEFGYEVKVSQKQVTLNILVTNAGAEVSEGFTVGDLWRVLDKTGVKPHIILPKRQGGRLAFQTNYQPHTRPIARSGGPGRATGPKVFARKVNHPGFPPRKFSEAIGKRLRRQFGQAIDRGIRIGARRRR
jgi:hypothetical protein